MTKKLIETNKSIIFGLSNGKEIAENIAKTNKYIQLGQIERKLFIDSEILIRSKTSVRNCNTFIVQSIVKNDNNGMSVNDSLMELLIFIDSLRRASVRNIHLIIPYLGYSRQDRKTRSHEPISARLIANLLEIDGIDRLITYDVHSLQIQGFFNVAFDNITTIPQIAKYIKNKYFKNEKSLNNYVVVSPDAGGMSRCYELAKYLNCNVAFIDKNRTTQGFISIKNIRGNLDGKTPIIIDDIINSGKTILKTIAFLSKNFTCKKPIVSIVHSLANNETLTKLNSVVSELIFTNTIINSSSINYKKYNNVTILRIEEFLNDVLLAWLFNSSISSLYKQYYFSVPKYHM